MQLIKLSQGNEVAGTLRSLSLMVALHVKYRGCLFTLALNSAGFKMDFQCKGTFAI